jgi:hypothetical protein
VKFGELCIPVAVNPVDGFVRLGHKDPQDIDAVEYGLITTGDGGQECFDPGRGPLARSASAKCGTSR